MALLLYIHGFLSSPLSDKAQKVQRWCHQQQLPLNYQCPALPAYPAQAMAVLEEWVRQYSSQPLYLLGSSLGGYYATYLAEKYGARAVLINPAVAPYDLMTDYIHQDLQNYHTQDNYRLSEQHIDELRQYEVNKLSRPEDIWLMVQTGDETLDYRLAVEKYRHCPQLVEPGGDHSFQNFEQWLPAIFDFFNNKAVDSQRSTVDSLCLRHSE